MGFQLAAGTCGFNDPALGGYEITHRPEYL